MVYDIQESVAGFRGLVLMLLISEEVMAATKKPAAKKAAAKPAAKKTAAKKAPAKKKK
jgi:hypothetical protein